ncbi:hypothetical protein P7K49_034363 [Saguinus oedipus]|uniref:Uncharacterized protein n=1 Tax=Saguinus oedipus TaxID=9490 RepID=A0ABQ9TUI3_SAGOE|nr:hypothetical protein P7K49_034363 [Saguinus oedipus]
MTSDLGAAPCSTSPHADYISRLASRLGARGAVLLQGPGPGFPGSRQSPSCMQLLFFALLNASVAIHPTLGSGPRRVCEERFPTPQAPATPHRKEGPRPGSSLREDSLDPAGCPLRLEAGSGLGPEAARPEPTTPRRHRGGVDHTSLGPRRRPREAARAGLGAGADREAGAKNGGCPTALRVRRPRGAPPPPGAAAPGAPPPPPGPAVVVRDAEPGAAGGAARGERRGERGLPAALALVSHRRTPVDIRVSSGQALLAPCRLEGTGEPAASLPPCPARTAESEGTSLPFERVFFLAPAEGVPAMAPRNPLDPTGTALHPGRRGPPSASRGQPV